MTQRKDLKRLVRERQRETGERYTTALAYVRAQEHTGVRPVTDPEPASYDATVIARGHGLRCTLLVSRALWWRESDPAARELLLHAAIATLREELEALGHEPGYARIRRVILRGERYGIDAARPWSLGVMYSALTFAARIREGHRGPSPRGDAVAFDVTLRGNGVLTLVAYLMPSPGDAPARVMLACAGSEPWSALTSAVSRRLN